MIRFLRRPAILVFALLVAAASAPTATTGTIMFAGSTVAGLRLYHPFRAAPYAARIAGYSIDGDGGGGEYVWQAGSSAADDGCGTIAPSGSATGRWAAVVPDGGFNVRRCGAAGNGASDDTAAFQAAVNVLCAMSSGGGTLRVPLGDFGISAGVGVSIACEGINIDGMGWGDRDANTRGSKIRVVGMGSAPIFNFTGAIKNATSVRYSFGGGVRDLMFLANNGASPAQLGPMVALSYCWGCVVERVYSFNAYRFVTNFAGIHNHVRYFSADQMAPGGEAIKYFGSDSGCEPSNLGNCPTRGDLFEISHGVIDAAIVAGQSNSGCIRITDFAATTWVDHVACLQTSLGINVDCPTSTQIGACPQFISAIRFEAETNGQSTSQNAGVALSDVVHFECDDCELYGYGTTNDVLAASTRFSGSSQVKFVGGYMSSALNQCVLSSVQGLTLDGVDVYGCNVSNGGFYGVELRQNSPGGVASGTAYSGSNTLVNNHFCFALGSAPTSMGGVLIQAAQGYNVVTANTFRGCTSAVVNNGGSPATDVIANNTGL